MRRSEDIVHSSECKNSEIETKQAENIDENTLCGYVRNCERENEEKGILTFKELKDFQADMFTLIIIGNSTTKLIKNQLVTPRGYKGI